MSIVIVTGQRLQPGRHGVFLIFRTAFFDLMAHRNLYATHTAEHLDYFRYSPTFALLFAPIAILPWPAGLLLWTGLNAVALYLVIGRLLPRKPAQIVRFLVLGDLVRSLQSSQSNALVTALMIAAFIAFEEEKAVRGGWAVAAGAGIKIFPVGAGLFALIRPSRRRALLAITGAMALLIALPVAILGPRLLLQEYRWWFANEAAEIFKPMYSLMDLIDAWSEYYWPRWPTQLAGLALLLLPVVIRRDAWGEAAWRLRLLCSVLVFCVLFNHGAESPSYVIAMAGIAIWWVATPRSTAHNVLLLLTILLSTIGRSSVVPPAIRLVWLDPGRTMVLPFLAAWILMQVELLRGARVGGLEPPQDQVAPVHAAA